jgi:hypothetical protein
MTDKQPEAYEVPFVELLESVPNNSRLWVDFPEGMGSTHFPVGHYCHKAAAELRRLHEVNAELVKALEEVRSDIRHMLKGHFVHLKDVEEELSAAIAKATEEQQ